METLVVYDSVYGNTEKIARAIASTAGGEARAFRSGGVNISELKSVDLLIVGAPTYGGRPTPAALEFLNKLTKADIKGKAVAAFDTRLRAKWVMIFGYAAAKINATLKARGANPVVAPEGFFVKGTKGPLKDGEIERAEAWGKEIIKNKK